MKHVSRLWGSLLTVLVFGASCAGEPQYFQVQSSNEVAEELNIPPLTEVDDPSPDPGTFRDLIALDPDPVQSLGVEDPNWYRDAVFYHIWISAFRDSDGDGVGDIPGIIESLDYLQELGITGIWLSPFYDSVSQPINLHMYDIIDHYKVDPRFGTNEDLDRLLMGAHDRGIRVIFDYVPNHVSDQHPWFQESANNENDRRDWFVWRNEPGSQQGPWGQSVWHGKNGSNYYGVFWSGMPDINFRHQAAKDAVTNVGIYWLNRGFDGMRIDAVKYLYEDVRSIPGEYADQAETIQYFQALREQVLDAFSGFTDSAGRPLHKFMVAENWTDSNRSLINYMYQDDKEGFQMTFDFPMAYSASRGDISGWIDRWEWSSLNLPAEAWMATFLSNHDNVVIRPNTIHREIYPAVISAQLMGTGTPFIYYGNEIGMPDVPRFEGAPHADRRHRQPFQWEQVEEQDLISDSLLNTHRALIELRSQRPSLSQGDFKLLAREGSLVAFERALGEELTLAVINLSRQDWEGELLLEDWQSTLSEARPNFALGGVNLVLGNTALEGSMPAGTSAVWFLEE